MPWSAQIHAKFHVHRITQELPRRSLIFGYGSLTLWGAGFHRLHLISELPYRGPTTPGDKSPGLGCYAFARHYLRNRISFLFLRLLRCFTSPGVAPTVLYIQTAGTGHDSSRVTPLGNPRVIACLPLTVAYRSLPRPSSPIGTKASIIHSL